MTRTRLVLSVSALTLLSGLLGCDVAVVALLAARGNKKSTSSSTPSGPDLSFRLWVAELGAIAGSTEQGTIDANNGDPDQSKWTQLPSATTSGEYTMPTPKAGGFDSILVQATDAQIYEVDSFEIIDATGTTIETAGATNTFSNSEITALALKDAQGPPNGVGTLTNATSTKRSFIFMKRSTPITTFRVNLWQQNAPRISGDVEWVNTIVRSNDQLAGGAAINSSEVVYLSFKEGSALYMARLDLTGNIVQDSNLNDLTTLETTTPSTFGSASIAIAGNDDVFVATTRNAGDIRLQKFTGINASPTWQAIAIATSGADRVEANGLALNSEGDLVLAGGADYGGANGVGHYYRKFSKANGSDMWSLASPAPPAPPLDTTTSPSPTYWYCVATDTDSSGNLNIFASGNLASILVVGSADTYTSKTLDACTEASPSGGVTEVWNNHTQGGLSQTAPSLGRTIGVDSSHNVYIAGFATGTGLDSYIVKYAGGNSTPGPHFSSSRTGDDEFLDIAVEADGTIYATGYESNSGQQDLVLYKLQANGGVAWKRTLDFNGGADRGVSVMTSTTHVFVVGQVTNTGGDLDIHVRKYVK